ncbi:MAG: response regulator [Candidatus Omnitrophica bacterium]|nr:response regulator [Candidatus Omnitrophota bacterium]
MLKRKILIIDDDVELCEGMATLLRHEGYMVENTSDVFAGVNLIEEQEFNVVLLDFRMKGMNGIDILKKIQSKNSKMKVFIISGQPSIEELLEDEKVSHLVAGIINKPFSAKVLLEKIKKSLEIIPPKSSGKK